MAPQQGPDRDRSTVPLRAHNAIPRDRVLDAARDIVEEVGLRGFTMADLARRADVSRATLYRTWPNGAGVVADLFTREFRNVMQLAMGQVSAHDARSVLVRGSVAIVQHTRRLPFLRRVIELDPEFIATYLLHRRGSSTNEQTQLLEDLIRDGQSDGSIRAGDASIMAAAVLLDAWSFVITGPVFVGEDRLDPLDEELLLMLDRYLSP
ncbi:TetR/AcrR family transcriptional regulator [Mumia sp. zg.B17]|uniref:TetR/AcrR family transcriptional regulator n=1 Tax=unclassified Mumia TaxID=2621872 RepID=UPI001C6DEA31|nr:MULTISPECIES: TetR/AcrR family transcriptional regulator [unclassified Mumia]MBW9205294.1 TetR/AcrR family transcriptional regulator [Mumia sp. zg.B17]MBW9208707.1 TetR/AcrR family transcriptional regulator [Mumia sp. zg.B21]MDD9350592.1 TetR/AcrR family transcriptional regulator [Mumia sp.]